MTPLIQEIAHLGLDRNLRAPGRIRVAHETHDLIVPAARPLPQGLRDARIPSLQSTDNVRPMLFNPIRLHMI